ncbi:glycoside hydrolase family 16 protein [Arthrobacter globiformis]|uniref:glycoside hydrolase family 16 protein n=1 Tax=Arthrobacter globiformis TaxID=1665 RepID=UPI00397954CC
MLKRKLAATVTSVAVVALAAAALTVTGHPTEPTPALGPVLAVATSSGVQAAVLRGWGAVVAGDEFSYTGAPSALKWTVYNGAGHAGKGIRSPKAWNVANGVATVTGNAYGTTGGMAAKFAMQKYGRWEVRMRTSVRDPKYHPVLLLWPNANTGVTTCPEVDYAESLTDTTLVKFNLHYACPGPHPYQAQAARKVDTTQWHNYAVQWNSAGITGYIDGVLWFTDTNKAQLPPAAMHQTLQLDWFPNGTATKPSWMQIDWVRVYR